ncbi:MAG: hypothetical protein ACFCUQ_03325, partial [Kiloniellales bacterium]
LLVADEASGGAGAGPAPQADEEPGLIGRILRSLKLSSDNGAANQDQQPRFARPVGEIGR